MEPLVLAAAAFLLSVLGLLVYLVVWLQGSPDGPVLPHHYSVERYAVGSGSADRPDRVGVCQDCGVWTDPDEGFCPICTGHVERVIREA